MSNNGNAWSLTKMLAVGSATILGLVIGVPVIVGVLSAWDSTNAGQVAVVRNGGAFSNSNIRLVIQPASSLKWTGIWSSTHKYPATQRFYTITSAPSGGDRAGVDVVQTPSSDGVEMGIEGTLYFSLNLDTKTIKDFDNKFGTRTFTGADGKTRHAYDGDAGWSDFLDQIIRPVIDNDLRQQVGDFRCAELVSSCALVQNTANATAPAGNNNSNIAKVQDAINSSMATDLKNTLGDDFLTNIHFNLVKVTLPPNVQDAVNKAQAAYAQVSETQAQVVQAKALADANKAKQDGYNACPICGQIDLLKALPPGVTVFAPGSGTGLPLTGSPAGAK